MHFPLMVNDETIDHLETLYETESLKDENVHEELKAKLNHLGRKLNNFLQSVIENHKTNK